MKLWDALKRLFSEEPELPPGDYIDAVCLKCRRMRVHKIDRHTYKCTVCGNEQDDSEAITQEDTAW